VGRSGGLAGAAIIAGAGFTFGLELAGVTASTPLDLRVARVVRAAVRLVTTSDPRHLSAARGAAGVLAGAGILSVTIVAVLVCLHGRLTTKLDRVALHTAARFDRHLARLAEHHHGFVDGYRFQSRPDPDLDRSAEWGGPPDEVSNQGR
jgi:hypothetical protein